MRRCMQRKCGVAGVTVTSGGVRASIAAVSAARRAAFYVGEGSTLQMLLSGIRRATRYDASGLLDAKHKLAAANAPAGQAASGGPSSMKSAGRTTVRGQAPAPAEGFSEKVKNWIEKKGAEAGSASQAKKPGKPTGKKR